MQIDWYASKYCGYAYAYDRRAVIGEINIYGDDRLI